MITRLSSYFFLSLGVLGLIYLAFNYRADLPNKELWIICNIFFMIIGGFLFVQQKLEAFRQQLSGPGTASNPDHLKKTGEKIRVTVNNCAIRTGSTHRDDAGKLRETYIVFTKEYNRQLFEFISEPTAAAPEALKKYLDDNKGIDLYVDKQNPANYYFDVTS